MPGVALLTVEVPDDLVGVGIVVGEEAPAVDLGEDPGVSPSLAGHRPGLLGDRAQVEDVDDEEIARFGPFDADRAAEHVTTVQVDVPDVVGRVVVTNLAVRPFPALDADLLAGAHLRHRGHVRMPPVVAGDVLLRHGAGRVVTEHYVGHSNSSQWAWSDVPAVVVGSMAMRAARRVGHGPHVARRLPAHEPFQSRVGPRPADALRSGFAPHHLRLVPALLRRIPCADELRRHLFQPGRGNDAPRLVPAPRTTLRRRSAVHSVGTFDDSAFRASVFVQRHVGAALIIRRCERFRRYRPTRPRAGRGRCICRPFVNPHPS